MAYPSTIDAPDTTMQGGSFLATNDHALSHRVVGSAAISIENKLGLGAGSAAANQILTGSGSGTSAWSQTWNAGTLGTATLVAPTINGAGTNSGTVSGGMYGTATVQGGTGISMVLGTPAIDVIGARNSGTAVVFADSIAPQAGTIVDVAGGTYAVNAQANQIFYSVIGTAAGNRTIGTPTNPTPYQQLTYAFKTSGSSNGTLVWTSIHRISQDLGTPTLGTGVGWNYFNWRYNPIDTKYDFMGQSLNLI